MDALARKRAEDGGMLFLPDTYLRARGIDPASVAPSWLAPAKTILESPDAIEDLCQVGGRNRRGTNLTLVGTNGQPLMIVHDDQTEAAEIEDLAHEAVERRQPIDFAAARERQGLPSASKFDELLRTAAEDFIHRAKANPRTVRRRDPNQQYVRGLVTVPAMPGL